MRRKIIAGNWKLFKTLSESVTFAESLKPLVASNSSVDIVVAPVFTSLSKTAEILAGSNIKLAAQDCFWKEEGAFTGEVSPGLLKDAGCEYVIIGHSERRLYFGESDETVCKKCRLAIADGLTAIVCVGESLEEREANETFKVVERQVLGSLSGFSGDDFSRIIIAYEPVWAIGTGRTASAEQAGEVHTFIRSLISSLAGSGISESIRIIYGGSVKPDNAENLMKLKDIDGALVGGASLDPKTFAQIVNSIP